MKIAQGKYKMKINIKKNITYVRLLLQMIFNVMMMLRPN